VGENGDIEDDEDVVSPRVDDQQLDEEDQDDTAMVGAGNGVDVSFFAWPMMLDDVYGVYFFFLLLDADADVKDPSGLIGASQEQIVWYPPFALFYTLAMVERKEGEDMSMGEDGEEIDLGERQIDDNDEKRVGMGGGGILDCGRCVDVLGIADRAVGGAEICNREKGTAAGGAFGRAVVTENRVWRDPERLNTAKRFRSLFCLQKAGSESEAHIDM
jgi:hypothetical protein